MKRKLLNDLETSRTCLSVRAPTLLQITDGNNTSGGGSRRCQSLRPTPEHGSMQMKAKKSERNDAAPALARAFLPLTLLLCHKYRLPYFIDSFFSAPRPRHCATLVLLFFHHFSSLPRIKSMSWVTDASNWHGWKYTTHVLNCRPSSKYINDIQLNDENKGVRSKKSFSTRCVSAETWQWVVTHSTIGQSPRHVCGFHTLQIIVSIQNVRLSSWR